MGAPVGSERERETAADRRLYLEIGFTPIACSACGVEVAVQKNSPTHTSIQWTRAAVAACPVLAADSGLRLGCPRLTASVEQAVRDGAVSSGWRFATAADTRPTGE